MVDNQKNSVPGSEPANLDANKKIIDSIVKILDENSISSILISFDTEKNEPVVFYRGDFYEIAKLACKLANSFKNKIIDELS